MDTEIFVSMTHVHFFLWMTMIGTESLPTERERKNKVDTLLVISRIKEEEVASGLTLTRRIWEVMFPSGSHYTQCFRIIRAKDMGKVFNVLKKESRPSSLIGRKLLVRHRILQASHPTSKSSCKQVWQIHWWSCWSRGGNELKGKRVTCYRL